MMQYIAPFLVGLILSASGVMVGRAVQAHEDHGKAVCHSLTEDSIIYDCDYRNGGWYQK